MSLKLPFTVTCSVLACMEAEDRERLRTAELFDLSPEEMDGLLASRHFFKQRKRFLEQKVHLFSLFQDGLTGRVRAYNKLIKRNILFGHRRYSRANLSLCEEAENLYPLDEASVGYWLSVQAMDKLMLKHKLARLLQKRSKFHCHQASTFLFENCSNTIASTAYRLEHQFAKALLKQNLCFSVDLDDSDSISLASIASSVQTSNSSFPNSNSSSKVPSPPLSESSVKKLVHHNLFEEDNTEALYTPLAPQDFKWSLTGASWITETQTYYLIGDDGSFGLIQMGYSNITWPKTNCQVTALFYHPDDLKITHKFESQTVSSLRMKLSDANMSVAAQSSSIAVRASTPLSSCEMADASAFGYSINYAMGSEDASTPSPFTVKLEFDPMSEPFKIGDGKVFLGANKADGFVEMKFIPAGRFDGVVQVDKELFPFHGQGICFRQFLGVKPHNVTKRWNCAYFVEKPEPGKPRRTLHMVQMQCSAQYNHEEVHYGFYFDGKQVVAVTSAGNSIYYAKTKTDPENGYSVPDHFEYTWQGTDREGKPFEASVSGVPNSRVSRIDLMSSVPSMLRRVAESFTSARPFIYQYFDRDVEACINGETVRGDLFQEYSFLLEDPCQFTSPKI